MPPPMQTPSIRLTQGFGNSAIARFIAYSLAKKASTPSRSPASAQFAHPPHVAAGAEGAPARAFQDHQLHLRVVAEVAQRGVDRLDHRQVERVQRARAVHQDGAGRALAAGDDARFVGHGGVPRRLGLG